MFSRTGKHCARRSVTGQLADKIENDQPGDPFPDPFRGFCWPRLIDGSGTPRGCPYRQPTGWLSPTGEEFAPRLVGCGFAWLVVPG